MVVGRGSWVLGREGGVVGRGCRVVSGRARGTGTKRRHRSVLRQLRRFVPVTLSLSLALLLALTGCAPGTDEAQEPGAAAIENEAVGVRLLAVPEPFELVSDDADGVVLEVVDRAAGGTVRITLSEVYEGGLNIVEAVKTGLAEFQAMPDGESFGQTQLMAPIGLTYMLRGRYTAEGTPTEALRAIVAHPWGNRLLTVAYTYPRGDDTKERGEQLMGLLGEIEALPEPTPAGSTEPTEEAPSPDDVDSSSE